MHNEIECDGINLPRRGFLLTLWKVLSGLVLFEIVALTMAFFRFRGNAPANNCHAGIIDAGAVEAYLAGSVTPFVQGKFYLCRLENGGFVAVSRQCTHLGCSVPWNSTEQKFICPCHASTFDIRGDRLSPPAPRPLDLHPIFIAGGRLKVDTGKRIKRSEFRPDQVVFPEENAR
ncbi:MAG: Rieske 2Fe-2S domain-containing protein [Desulfobacteraceae bacterium]|nr:Rieske 2Fe-2S domain-containing protein [Desulfobacteraceae bacterium]